MTASINNFDSFVLFFISRFYRISNIVVKNKREKKINRYVSTMSACYSLHSQQHRINSFHSFVLFHLLSTVKKKKKTSGSGGTLSDSLGA